MIKLLYAGAAGLLLSLQLFAQSSNATVNSGSGDGNYRGAKFVHVWGDPAPAGMVFDRWTGDTLWLQNPLESHARLKTTKLSINITATYKAAPAWTPTFETLNGIQMGYFFPPSPVGVIFHFHGQGGSANLLFNNLERRIFANEAVAEGYAVVSLDSADRVNRDWNTSNDISTNPDIQNVQAAINLFISRGTITTQTPLFAHGFSKGAGFSPRVARALNFRATSMNLLAGTPDIINITTNSHHLVRSPERRYHYGRRGPPGPAQSSKSAWPRRAFAIPSADTFTGLSGAVLANSRTYGRRFSKYSERDQAKRISRCV